MRLIRRLESATGLPVAESLTSLLGQNPAPDSALRNLERWVVATSSPRMHLEQVLSGPGWSKPMVDLLGCSQPIADLLIQNPELAGLLYDPEERVRLPQRSAVEREGRLLLNAATSYTHGLDRIRFLRQRWLLPILFADLTGAVDQPTVWKAISDLCDAVITLSLEWCYRDAGTRLNLPKECPISIVAFGKLGAGELNYSSDVDLVYVLQDGLTEQEERDCSRCCEQFTRALSDKMGRGFLYRVDLRLRPFGATGALAPTGRAIEAYYDLYAETWETMALLRSRVVQGSLGFEERWDAIRERRCFRRPLSQPELESVLSMRQRVEAFGSQDDLKRGSGGIRDIEFFCQIHQLLAGSRTHEVRIRPTPCALAALSTAGIIDRQEHERLSNSYVFLRKLEHRIQLLNDRQTHAMPGEPNLDLVVARLMGYDELASFSEHLASVRRNVSCIYRDSVEAGFTHKDPRRDVGDLIGPLASQWFDGMEGGAAFYPMLLESQEARERVEMLLQRAPRLIPLLRESMSVTEMVTGGEIGEDWNAGAGPSALAVEADPQKVARRLADWWLIVAVRAALEIDLEPGIRLTELFDGVLRWSIRRVSGDIDLVALGSFGAEEIGFGSDLDVLFLCAEGADQATQERKCTELLAFLASLRRMGAPMEVDLRLRPDGGKGLLARTHDAFRAYELDGMATWERFALGHARLVNGTQNAEKLVRSAAYASPLTPERLGELLKMKGRIENERVHPQHYRWNVKLGHGGLSDIEWLVHLHEMRFPRATQAGSCHRITDRIAKLGSALLLNAVEVAFLIESHAYLLRLRDRLFLLGVSDDRVPENPDRLEALAQGYGFADGNAFLRDYRDRTEEVRRLYLDSIRRLGA